MIKTTVKLIIVCSMACLILSSCGYNKEQQFTRHPSLIKIHPINVCTKKLFEASVVEKVEASVVEKVVEAEGLIEQTLREKVVKAKQAVEAAEKDTNKWEMRTVAVDAIKEAKLKIKDVERTTHLAREEVKPFSIELRVIPLLEEVEQKVDRLSEELKELRDRLKVLSPIQEVFRPELEEAERTIADVFAVEDIESLEYMSERVYYMLGELGTAMLEDCLSKEIKDKLDEMKTRAENLYSRLEKYFDNRKLKEQIEEASLEVEELEVEEDIGEITERRELSIRWYIIEDARKALKRAQQIARAKKEGARLTELEKQRATKLKRLIRLAK